MVAAIQTAQPIVLSEVYPARARARMGGGGGGSGRLRDGARFEANACNHRRPLTWCFRREKKKNKSAGLRQISLNLFQWARLASIMLQYVVSFVALQH